MTTVRLAMCNLRQCAEVGGPFTNRPAILISYFYYSGFRKVLEDGSLNIRDWMLDSGAWSAHNCGAKIDLEEYTDFCLDRLANDPRLVEVAALDVIGNWQASAENTAYMHRRGVPALPTFHPGEPWECLEEMARESDKIALGGIVRWPRRRKHTWIGQCFARVWPKRIHGFGLLDPYLLKSYPFESCDASSWDFGPYATGVWKSLGNKRPGLRGDRQPIRVEVEHYLRLEAELKELWSKELANLKAAA